MLTTILIMMHVLFFGNVDWGIGMQGSSYIGSPPHLLEQVGWAPRLGFETACSFGNLEKWGPDITRGGGGLSTDLPLHQSLFHLEKWLRQSWREELFYLLPPGHSGKGQQAGCQVGLHRSRFEPSLQSRKRRLLSWLCLTSANECRILPTSRQDNRKVAMMMIMMKIACELTWWPGRGAPRVARHRGAGLSLARDRVTMM